MKYVLYFFDGVEREIKYKGFSKEGTQCSICIPNEELFDFIKEMTKGFAVMFRDMASTVPTIWLDPHPYRFRQR